MIKMSDKKRDKTILVKIKATGKGKHMKKDKTYKVGEANAKHLISTGQATKV